MKKTRAFTGKRLVSLLLLMAMAISMLPASLIITSGEESVKTVSDYPSLVAALSQAAPTDKIVIIGDITIPSGKTLSVPKSVKLAIAYNSRGEYGGHTAEDYSMDLSKYTEEFSSENAVYTLTVEEGATLDVYGALYVGGELVANSGQRYQGATGTLYSRLVCNGTLNLKEGSLYCYGYIDGDGKINTSGASSVYAPFVIGNFNGGGYVYGLYKVGKVSPLNHYVMPNIRASLSIKYGTSVYGLCALYSGGAVNVSVPKLVGTSQALLVLENSESVIVAKYLECKADDPTLTGKLCLDFYGEVVAGSLYMEIYYTPISTADVIFPIPYSLELSVKNGSTLKTANKFALLPGAGFTVEAGGRFEIGEKGAMYLTDGIKDTNSVTFTYPSGAALEENGYGMTADFTVEGTVDVLDGATFAGTIKNVKPGAVVSIASGATLSGKFVMGIAAAYNINFTDYAFYNKTEYMLTASALSPAGSFFDLEKGKTYYSADPNAAVDVESFEYIYYGTTKNAASQKLTCPTSYTVKGSLNTFAVIYNYADGSKKESASTTLEANTKGYVWYDMYTGRVISSISENGFYMLGESGCYVTFKNGDEEISMVVLDDGVIPTPDFSKEHYLLTGWSNSAGGEVSYPIGGKADFSHAVLYPVWTAQKYEVIYLLTPENYAIYNGDYLYIDKNGNYVIEKETVSYNTAVTKAPGDDVMGIKDLYFEWVGNLNAVEGNMAVFGEYFEYGVRNMRTGVVYPTLSSAIEAALNGDVVRIQSAISEAVEIPAELTVTIDLNGFELYAESGSVISNSGALTLTDSRENGAVVQKGKGVSSSSIYYAVTNNAGATLVINGADLVSDVDGIYTRALYNKGTVTLNDGIIRSGAGCAVYNYKSNSEGAFIQNGGQILYGGTSSSVYGVYNYNKATYVMNGGSVEAVNGGRAFYNWLNSTLDMYGGAISSTTGGALFNNGAVANIYGGTVSTNSLATLTYVVLNTKYAAIQATLNIYGGTISAPKGCRGIHNQKSTLNIYGGTVETTGNTNYSWAIYNNESSVANIYGGRIYAKSSHAIYNNSNTSATAPSLNVYGGHMISDAKSGYYAVITGDGTKYGKVTVGGGSFASNSANAIYTASANAVVTVTDGAFGGLYKYTSAPINSYKSSVELVMKAVNTTGAYKGYYCMTADGKGYEAYCGDVKYQYISMAIAEATTDHLVVLLDNAKLNCTAYPAGVIDLAGHTLDISANTLSCHTLYLKDSVGGGKLKGYGDGGVTTLLYSDEIKLMPADKDGDTFLGYSADGSTDFIISPVSKGELVLYPVYSSNASFTVIFKDENGNVVDEKVYSYKDKVVAPAAPEKVGDEVYKFVFTGWGPGFEELCLSNKVYTPVYSREYVEYTVIFYDYYGEDIGNGRYHYGESVIPPITPLLSGDENNQYEFIGWSDGETVFSPDKIPSVTADASYTASYVVTPYKTESRYEVRLSSATVLLNSSLTINFLAKAKDLSDYEKVFVVFERERADGSVTVTTEWDYKVNGDYLVFPYKNIAAKEMGDKINATLYAIKDGVKYSNKTVEYSILRYATGLLGKSSTAESFKSVLVDMLNYGSAAQIYFGYRTDALVNAGLTEEQKKYASWDGGEMSLKSVKAYQRIENESAKFKSVSLLFVDAVTVKYIMDLSGYTGDKSELSLVINYVNSLGRHCETVIGFDEFVENNQYHTASFDSIPTKDMSIAFTATIYRNYGSMDCAQVSGTTTYSIESYAYSNANSQDKKLGQLVKSMIAFGNSAKAYFAD